MANGLSACFFPVAFSSARIKAWRPGPSRSDRRQRALTDRCLTSVVSRKSQWLDASTIITYLKIQNFRQRILMQCNKVVCLSLSRVRMYVDLHSERWGGQGGRQTEGESEEDLDRNHPDIYNCTGQQPNCLTRSASLNAGVTLRSPGVGNAAADIFYFRFSVSIWSLCLVRKHFASKKACLSQDAGSALCCSVHRPCPR